jgi:hypothetical protein
LQTPRAVPLLALVALGAVACNDVEVLPFPAGQGQKKMAAAYPPGPYGLTKGQVINNYAFSGFTAPQMNADPTGVQPINLGDFYNPTGTDTFPAGSPYGAGTSKPKILFIDIGASWCGPCQVEAKDTPAQYDMYHPKGAEFLFVLADGPTTGVTALPNDLKNWVTKFHTAWPAGIDPDRRFVSNFGVAFPINMLVDTKTMAIVDLKSGQVDQAFYDELATLLAE